MNNVKLCRIKSQRFFRLLNYTGKSLTTTGLNTLMALDSFLVNAQQRIRFSSNWRKSIQRKLTFFPTARDSGLFSCLQKFLWTNFKMKPTPWNSKAFQIRCTVDWIYKHLALKRVRRWTSLTREILIVALLHSYYATAQTQLLRRTNEIRMKSANVFAFLFGLYYSKDREIARFQANFKHYVYTPNKRWSNVHMLSTCLYLSSYWKMLYSWCLITIEEGYEKV